jgi:hypothetical protein
MTPPTPRPRALNWTTPRDLCVTLPHIVVAPELAVLAALDQTLRFSAAAMLAAQPALLGDPPPWRLEPELLAARRLLDCATRLARAIARYRRCVLPAAEDANDGDHDERAF